MKKKELIEEQPPEPDYRGWEHRRLITEAIQRRELMLKKFREDFQKQSST